MFKWSCLVLGAAFLGLLTWLVVDLRQQVIDLRRQVQRSTPTVTREGEANTVMPDGQPAGSISIGYNPPCASPPRLSFPDGLQGWAISSEKADSFSINRTGTGTGTDSKLKWRAEGQPARTKSEEQIEDISRALDRLQVDSLHQAATNRAILREFQELRKEIQK